mmetsp:Transcript_20017/g.76685  ORF Transcript_20017/g.76685 Transcript_20017/m.76685 type:complete len:477 (-) Transcript_20017:635-2065(-)
MHSSGGRAEPLRQDEAHQLRFDEHLQLLVLRVGTMPRHSLDQENAKGEDVHLEGILLSLEHLGRHVDWRAHDGLALDQIRADGRDAQVAHLARPLLVDHEVRALDVPMNDVPRVQISHSLSGFGDQLEAHVDAEVRALGIEERAQRATVHELHDEDELVGLREGDAVELDDVRVLERTRELDLHEEVADDHVVVQLVHAEQQLLQRHFHRLLPGLVPDAAVDHARRTHANALALLNVVPVDMRNLRVVQDCLQGDVLAVGKYVGNLAVHELAFLVSSIQDDGSDSGDERKDDNEKTQEHRDYRDGDDEGIEDDFLTRVDHIATDHLLIRRASGESDNEVGAGNVRRDGLGHDVEGNATDRAVFALEEHAVEHGRALVAEGDVPGGHLQLAGRGRVLGLCNVIVHLQHRSLHARAEGVHQHHCHIEHFLQVYVLRRRLGVHCCAWCCCEAVVVLVCSLVRGQIGAVAAKEAWIRRVG